MSNKRMNNQKLTKKQKAKMVQEMFNRKTKDWDEVHFEDDDWIRTDDGKVEFLNKEIVALIKEAFEQNKQVRFNMKESVVFIEK